MNMDFLIFDSISGFATQGVRHAFTACLHGWVTLLRSPSTHPSTVLCLLDACALMYRSSDDLSLLLSTGLAPALLQLMQQGDVEAGDSDSPDSPQALVHEHARRVFVALCSQCLWWRVSGLSMIQLSS
jgi:hypothetical protein